MKSWKTEMKLWFKIEQLYSRVGNKIQILQLLSQYHSQKMIFPTKIISVQVFHLKKKKKNQFSDQRSEVKGWEKQRNCKCYISLKLTLYLIYLLCKNFKSFKISYLNYYTWSPDSPAMDLNNSCYVKLKIRQILKETKQNKTKTWP